MSSKQLARSVTAACLLGLAALPFAGPALADHGGRGDLREAKAATARFNSLGRAQAAGYTNVVQDTAGNTCIAEPGMGAMGVHYLNPALLDDSVEATTPELVVYEPRSNGKLRLVANEYLVFQDAWDATHSSPPSLFGHTFDSTPFPNRFGLPAYYSLHAWIWKSNPSGMFAMWNPRVSCG